MNSNKQPPTSTVRRAARRAKGLVSLGLAYMDAVGNESGETPPPSPKVEELYLAGLVNHIQIRIAVTGARGTGKTSFIYKCAGVTSGTRYNSTKVLQHFGMNVQSRSGGSAKITFVDLPEGRDMADARSEVYATADAIVMMFNLTDLGSLHAIKSGVFPDIMTAKGLNHIYDDLDLPCILVGNVLDLSREREVTRSDAEDMAAVYRCPYREISVRTGQGVADCFKELVTTAVDFNTSPRAAESKKKKKCTMQ